MKFVLGFTAPSLDPFHLVGVFFMSMEPHPHGTSMWRRMSTKVDWQDKEHVSCILLGAEVELTEASIPLHSRVFHGVEGWLVVMYSIEEFSKPWTWIISSMTWIRKIWYYLKCLSASSRGNGAVTGDGGITSTICCLVHWWLVVMCPEGTEGFAQVITCNPVNEAQGKHFRNSGTMKSSKCGPVDPNGITERSHHCMRVDEESGCSSKCHCLFWLPSDPHFTSLSPSHGICQYCCQHTVSPYRDVLATCGSFLITNSSICGIRLRNGYAIKMINWSND